MNGLTTFIAVVVFLIGTKLHDGSDAEDEWKWSSEDDEINLRGKFDNNDDENIRRKTKIKHISNSKFKCKRFRISTYRSIYF
jgi:hypothetical protein